MGARDVRADDAEKHENPEDAEQKRAGNSQLEPHLQHRVVGVEGHDVTGPRLSLDNFLSLGHITRGIHAPAPDRVFGDPLGGELPDVEPVHQRRDDVAHRLEDRRRLQDRRRQDGRGCDAQREEHGKDDSGAPFEDVDAEGGDHTDDQRNQSRPIGHQV